MISKLIATILLIVFMVPAVASANSLVNNQAVAIIDGSIIQHATDNSNNEVNVGSIIVNGNTSARNISTKVFVAEDIIVKSAGKDIRVNIGSVEVNK